jgi:dTDP-4-dehydrorhamnose reductase
MTRVLLLGGGGQLGSEIRREWNARIDSPTHSEADIADGDSVSRALESGYDLVVNCAAFHNVDACEAQPESAFRYNAIAVDGLGALCAERDVAFLTISTDYVFDGETDRPYTERDVPRPIQTYGVSKLAGELLVQRRESKAFIVRTCGIYGVQTSSTKGYTFIDRVLSQLRSGEQSRVVSDVIASPTYARHLAQALWKLVETKAYGLYHAVNPGPVSWCDFASEAARQAGIERKIEPISAASWKAPARRPRYSALANEGLEQLGIMLPDWREGIAAYLKDKADSSAGERVERNR